MRGRGEGDARLWVKTGVTDGKVREEGRVKGGGGGGGGGWKISWNSKAQQKDIESSSKKQAEKKIFM